MFRCQFPGCRYETTERHRIHYHHIKPKEFSGVDDEYNRLWLCPNCHNRVYIPESKGIHSKQSNESIIIKGKLMSSGGIVLNYIDNKNEEQYYAL